MLSKRLEQASTALSYQGPYEARPLELAEHHLTWDDKSTIVVFSEGKKKSTERP